MTRIAHVKLICMFLFADLAKKYNTYVFFGASSMKSLRQKTRKSLGLLLFLVYYFKNVEFLFAIKRKTKKCRVKKCILQKRFLIYCYVGLHKFE